ncbi:MAG: YbaB/EbfC family nucleoid-associated protein [Capsulimonadales bacterium]|nr:YbaB/EbfC family nucleoid-associated protein [Capsulimonadales bacterium]
MALKGAGGGGMGNLGGPGMMKMIQDMQKKLKDDAEKMQEKLDSASFDGSSGGGTVKASVNGHGMVLEVKIKKEAVDPEDVEMLEDLIVTALREALEKAAEVREEEQRKLMPANIPGLNIPGLF